MLTAFARELWIADGPCLTGAAGFVFPTRMAVIRLDSGALALWSPVALAPALAGAVSALGPVAHLVALNHLHHTHTGDWQAAFPAARLHAPR